MTRALIGDGESPAAGASSLSKFIPSVSHRSSTCNHDDARVTAKNRLQGDDHITDYSDFAGNDFGKQTADSVGYLRSCRPSDTNTRLLHLSWIHASYGAGLANDAVQRFTRMHLPESYDVAAAGSRRGEQRIFITHCAGSLGTAAVETEKNTHERISTIRYVGRWLHCHSGTCDLNVIMNSLTHGPK